MVALCSLSLVILQFFILIHAFGWIATWLGYAAKGRFGPAHLADMFNNLMIVGLVANDFDRAVATRTEMLFAR